MSSIEQRLRNVLVDWFWISEGDVSQESTVDSLGMDSLDEVEFVMGAEEKFDIQIPDAEAEQCKTFGDFVAMVTRIVEGK